MAIKNYEHWKLQLGEEGVLWLAIDRKDSSVNSLSRGVLEELDLILDDIAKDQSIKSVIIYSAKKTGFVAGADVSQFVTVKTAEEAFDLIRHGQLIFDKLAALPQYTVAMIEGFCLGGGFELALACKYRVAEEGRHTRLGLPEVFLAIHPGWGGTTRLPCLIGAIKAMKLILTGKTVSAQKAKELGFVDAAVPRRVLKETALYYALSHPKMHQPGFLASLTNHDFVRPFLAKKFMAELKKHKKEEHYRAPYAVVRNWEKYHPATAEALLQEARSICQLMVHSSGHNLVRAFFLKDRLKALAKGLKFKAKHVHVIGSGTMGSAIAAWCVLTQPDITVTLQDKTPQLVAAGLKKANAIFKAKLHSKREILLAKDRLNADIEGVGIEKADVVVEAIIEDLEAKHELYLWLEPMMKPEALLATNTSSLALSDLSRVLKDPSRLVAIHFFNPVEKMELVEVASDPSTDKRRVEDAIAFVKQINRLPLPVLSKPGFLVNRILMPYLFESMILLKEGIPAPFIDEAALDFGMPMGPIELIDRVGLDICLSVAHILAPTLNVEVPPELQHRVTAGKLGVKSGEGFYRYRRGEVIKNVVDPNATIKLSEKEVTDRLIYRMLNESVACLRESIVSDADLLDAGMIFGTGFAPFLGGPIKYVKDMGIEKAYQRLEELADQYGDRFKPDEGWKSLNLFLEDESNE